MRYAFMFDASACTGCKACQAACKDKNGLPAGVLWRRVYEVSGGTWERRGAAWANTVFAYNVSVACNHCEEPACASACPTGAYAVREDGIVWLDTSKCVGCQYCAWACPYSAPQYSPELGHTTKCDFCADLVDEGLPPACVAACPMRALDFSTADECEVAEGTATGGAPGARALWAVPASQHPFPLPPVSHTAPRITVKPHPSMLNVLPKQVANREEVHPREAAARGTFGGLALAEELPLVIFTLLGQMAAGMSIVSLLLNTPPERPLLLTIGVLAALAGLVSLLHLGTASRAWRAPARWPVSPLSRETLMLSVFGGAWLLALFAPRVGHVALAFTGAGLVYSMAEVYRIDVVPGWNTWRTTLSFALSALLLGLIGVVSVASLPRQAVWWTALISAAAVAQQFISRWRFYAQRQAKTM